MIKDRYDVIIVGAGPAGTTTAKNCAEHGLDVLVLDRNNEIGTPKRCGEGLSANSVEKLKLKMPGRCIAQNINGAIVYAPNGRRIDIAFEGTKGFVLERKFFDKWLAFEASRKGAKIVSKSYVFDLIKNNGFIHGVKANVMGDLCEIKGDVIVAADGVESVIARKAGMKTNKIPSLSDTGFQYEMSGIDIENTDMIQLFFGFKTAPRGYVWIFPKGNDIANVGIGITGMGAEKTAKQYLDSFIQKTPGLRKGSIIEVNAGCIPVGGFMESMVANGVIGVGDSVNQVNPIHGGGIAESMIAGGIAADVIANAKSLNDFSEKNLSAYNKLWWEQRGKHLRNVEKVREAFENMSDEQMNSLAEVLSGEDLTDMAHGKNLAKIAKILIKYKMKNFAKTLGFSE